MPTFNTPEARDRTIRAILSEAKSNDSNGWASAANLIKSRADSGQYGARSVTGALAARDANGQYLFPSQDPGKTSSAPAIAASDPLYQRAGAIADQVFGGPAPAASSPAGINPNATAILGKVFTDRGVSPQVAAGAVAGMMGKSGAKLDPTAFNSKDPHGGAGGIAQWNGNRLIGPNGMLAFARSQGVDVNPDVPTDAKKVPFQVQAAYLGHELDTSYNHVLKGLQVSNSGQEGLTNWVNNFEVPADKAGAIAQRSQYVAPVTATLQRGDAAGPASSAAPAAAASASVPAANAQPASAIAPGSSGGKFAVPPAGAYPGSDKVSVIQGMTTGTGRNPQITTAMNLGNLFGGGATPVAPGPDLAQRVPLANTPMPPARPTDAAPIDTNTPLPWQGPAYGPPQPTAAQKPMVLPTLSASDFNTPAAAAHVPVWGPPHAGGSPTNPIAQPPSSIMPNPGAASGAYDPDEHPNLTPDAHIPSGSGGRYPAVTTGQPTLGFPAQANPFGQPPAQTSSLPGSMFASAQNLINFLFPQQTG